MSDMTNRNSFQLPNQLLVVSAQELRVTELNESNGAGTQRNDPATGSADDDVLTVSRIATAIWRLPRRGLVE